MTWTNNLVLKIWLYKSLAKVPRVVSNSVALWQCNNNSHSLHVKTTMESPYSMNYLHLIFGMTINITFITNNDIATAGILLFTWIMAIKVIVFDYLFPSIIILYKIPLPNALNCTWSSNIAFSSGLTWGCKKRKLYRQ